MTVEQSDVYEADLLAAKKFIPKDANIIREEITDDGAVIELNMNDTSDLEFLFKEFDPETNRLRGCMIVHNAKIIKYEDVEEVKACDTTGEEEGATEQCEK